MRITFERVDNNTPFKIGTTSLLGPDESPCFAINSMLGINSNSKASAKGFVFVDKNVSIEFVCRFMAFVMKRWPDTIKTFKGFVDEVARSEVSGQLQAGADSSAVHSSAPGNPTISV